MRVIAVDPGGTTGYAEWCDHERLHAPGLQAVGQVDDWQAATSLILGRHPDVLVVESFIITVQTAKLARSYDALYMIGALGYEAKLRGIKVAMQTPATRMFATPKKFAALGWKVTGDHATQAARHLLTWLFENDHITAMELSLGDC